MLQTELEGASKERNKSENNYQGSKKKDSVDDGLLPVCYERIDNVDKSLFVKKEVDASPNEINKGVMTRRITKKYQVTPYMKELVMKIFKDLCCCELVIASVLFRLVNELDSPMGNGDDVYEVEYASILLFEEMSLKLIG